MGLSFRGQIVNQPTSQKTVEVCNERHYFAASYGELTLVPLDGINGQDNILYSTLNSLHIFKKKNQKKPQWF